TPEKLRRIVEISSSVPPNERLLLSARLESEEARLTVLHYLEQSGIPQSLTLKNGFGAMLAMHRGGSDFALLPLLDRMEEREQKIVSELSFPQAAVDPQAAAAQALDCLRALEAKNVEERRTTLKRGIAEAEARGDFGEALRLVQDLKET